MVKKIARTVETTTLAASGSIFAVALPRVLALLGLCPLTILRSSPRRDILYFINTVQVWIVWYELQVCYELEDLIN